MASVLWADFIHEPMFQQTIRDVVEPQIVADKIAPLEARIALLEKALIELRGRQERDARVETAKGPYDNLPTESFPVPKIA